MTDTPTTAKDAAAPLSLASIQKTATAVVQEPGFGQAEAILEDEAESVRTTFTRSGWKSSEFWLTLGIVVLGTIPVLVQVWQGHATIEGSLPFLAATAKAISYTTGRSKVKAAEATAAATP